MSCACKNAVCLCEVSCYSFKICECLECFKSSHFVCTLCNGEIHRGKTMPTKIKQDKLCQCFINWKLVEEKQVTENEPTSIQQSVTQRLCDLCKGVTYGSTMSENIKCDKLCECFVDWPAPVIEKQVVKSKTVNFPLPASNICAHRNQQNIPTKPAQNHTKNSQKLYDLMDPDLWDIKKKHIHYFLNSIKESNFRTKLDDKIPPSNSGNPKIKKSSLNTQISESSTHTLQASFNFPSISQNESTSKNEALKNNFQSSKTISKKFGITFKIPNISVANRMPLKKTTKNAVNDGNERWSNLRKNGMSCKTPQNITKTKPLESSPKKYRRSSKPYGRN